MIGFLFLYFIGKAFYTIKEQSKKGKWVYAILGIASYYFGAFSGGILIGIVLEFRDAGSTDSIPDRAWDFIALPFGLLSCWGLYKYLKHQQTKVSAFDSAEILDGNLLEKEQA